MEVESYLADGRVLFQKVKYGGEFLVVLAVYHHIEGCVLQVFQHGTVVDAHDAYP